MTQLRDSGISNFRLIIISVDVYLVNQLLFSIICKLKNTIRVRMWSLLFINQPGKVLLVTFTQGNLIGFQLTVVVVGQFFYAVLSPVTEVVVAGFN